jgi:hypothetical protein
VPAAYQVLRDNVLAMIAVLCPESCNLRIAYDSIGTTFPTSFQARSLGIKETSSHAMDAFLINALFSLAVYCNYGKYLFLDTLSFL